MHLHPGLGVDFHVSPGCLVQHAVVACVRDERHVTVAVLVLDGGWTAFHNVLFVQPGETAPAAGPFVTLKGAKVEREATPPAQPVPTAEAALETPSPVQPEEPTTRASENQVESAPATA